MAASSSGSASASASPVANPLPPPHHPPASVEGGSLLRMSRSSDAASELGRLALASGSSSSPSAGMPATTRSQKRSQGQQASDSGTQARRGQPTAGPTRRADDDDESSEDDDSDSDDDDDPQPGAAGGRSQSDPFIEKMMLFEPNYLVYDELMNAEIRGRTEYHESALFYNTLQALSPAHRIPGIESRLEATLQFRRSAWFAAATKRLGDRASKIIQKFDKPFATERRSVPATIIQVAEYFEAVRDFLYRYSTVGHRDDQQRLCTWLCWLLSAIVDRDYDCRDREDGNPTFAGGTVHFEYVLYKYFASQSGSWRTCLGVISQLSHKGFAPSFQASGRHWQKLYNQLSERHPGPDQFPNESMRDFVFYLRNMLGAMRIIAI